MAKSKQTASSAKPSRSARKGAPPSKKGGRPSQPGRAGELPQHRRRSGAKRAGARHHPAWARHRRIPHRAHRRDRVAASHDPCGPDGPAPQRVRPRQRQERGRHHGLPDQQRSSGFKSVQRRLMPWLTRTLHSRTRSRACAVSTLRASRPAGARCSGGAPQRTCRSISCSGPGLSDAGQGARRLGPGERSRSRAAGQDRLGQVGAAAAGKLRQTRHPARPPVGRVLHRVITLDDGFAWNGTHILPEPVGGSWAITGTRWNGPRFFGLREVS